MHSLWPNGSLNNNKPARKKTRKYHIRTSAQPSSVLEVNRFFAMEVAIDAKLEAGRAAALKHHMHVKSIHLNRAPAPTRNNRSTSAYVEKVTQLHTHTLLA
jgi:hypothetical protein